jgi:NADH-quinone oxidoreductase subunit L
MSDIFYKNILELLVGLPIIFLIFYSISILFGIRPKEKYVIRYIQFLTTTLFLLNIMNLVGMIYDGHNSVELKLTPWFDIGTYTFDIKFKLDKISVPFSFLVSILCGIVAKYSSTYLHRDKGFYRFYLLFLVFISGCSLITLSGTIDLLFIGWELVGLSSVFLISFFYHRQNSINNSFKTLVSYRISDIGLLAGSAWMHMMLHSSSFDAISHDLPGHHFELNVMAGFIIFAALGKSAQLPFSSWLPGSMEGPTPSSAIFYGALSIHLGPYLLLRSYPILEHAEWAKMVLIGIGALTAIYGSGVGRTRTDAKTILAYATVSQVGIIFIEIGLGFTNFAIFHICAHAGLRTLQFLRAASAIGDFLDNPLIYENTIIKTGIYFEKIIPIKLQKKLYIMALNHFYLDYFIAKFVIRPFRITFELSKKLEDKYINWTMK